MLEPVLALSGVHAGYGATEILRGQHPRRENECEDRAPPTHEAVSFSQPSRYAWAFRHKPL